MDIDELQDFVSELEDLATYFQGEIDRKKFSESIKKVKKLFNDSGIETPQEIKMTRYPYDYRNELQKFGGYRERRERIKETFYPLIDYVESKIDISKQKEVFTQKKLNDWLRLNGYTIKTIYGNITDISITESCAGGNGVVYFGKINNHEVAIKFLLKSDKKKRNRFLCEFFNVLVGVDDNDGIVRQYFYEEVVLGNYKMPIIVMKKYPNHLEYIDNITQDELISKFDQLARALKKIHNSGIIHRDLKPKNILIDENGRLNIADFGISWYNPDIYDATGHTREGERLANYEFSAPEQSNDKKELTKAADIYSLGQIMYWLVHGEVCKGTRRAKITDKYAGPRMELLDSIVDKCIANDPKDRYQSIDEIYKDINEKLFPNGDVNVKKIKKDEKEIKEQLEDIMHNIMFTTTEDNNGEQCEISTFKIMNDFSEEQVAVFLEAIERKERELLFYEKVKMSDFFDSNEIMFFGEHLINKKYFSNLYDLYKEIADDESLYLPFLKYITKSFNENCVGIPF